MLTAYTALTFALCQLRQSPSRHFKNVPTFFRLFSWEKPGLGHGHVEVRKIYRTSLPACLWRVEVGLFFRATDWVGQKLPNHLDGS